LCGAEVGNISDIVFDDITLLMIIFLKYEFHEAYVKLASLIQHLSQI